MLTPTAAASNPASGLLDRLVAATADDVSVRADPLLSRHGSRLARRRSSSREIVSSGSLEDIPHARSEARIDEHELGAHVIAVHGQFDADAG